MEQMLIYVGIVVGLFLISSISIHIKRKLDLKDAEMNLVLLILETVDFIAQQFEFKHKESLINVVAYSIEALAFVNEFEKIEDLDIKKDIVKDKAIEICEREGVDLGDGTIIEIVDRIVDFILEQEIAQDLL